MKANTYILAVLLAVLPALGAIAQETDFDYAKEPKMSCDSSFQLSDFQLPNYHRRALTMNYSLGNTALFQRNTSSSYLQNQELNSSGKYRGNNFSLHVNASFSDILYTRKRQRETFISSRFQFDAKHSSDKDNSQQSFNKIRETHFTPNFHFAQNNRFYWNENLFWGVSPAFTYTLTANKNVGEEEFSGKYTSKDIAQSLQFRLPLEIGYGRIEAVGDARHAVYIFDALLHHGLTTAPKTADEIVRFGELIAQLKNKRYLDARHRKTYELQVLDSFLFANQYRDSLNMLYFTTLEEFWEYGNISRLSGKRWSFFVSPDYNFSSLTTKSNRVAETHGYNSQNVLDMMFGLDFSYEKPINLYWQNSLSTSLGYRTQNSKSYEKDFVMDFRSTRYLHYAHLNYFLSHKITYYPTTRTNLYGAYGLNYSLLSDDVGNVERTRHLLGANIGCGLNYYFSPQLQFSMGASLDYLYDNRENKSANFKNKYSDSTFEFYLIASLNYVFY